MKKLNAYLLVVLLSIIGFACKEDPLESITIKSSGKLSVTLMNGNQPLANQKVWLENLRTEMEDVFLTDESGTIDFGLLNEGPYFLYAEIEEPYTEIRQELHVHSGETIQKEIQIQDHVGTFKCTLKDSYSGDLVTEDLGLKILFVPINDVFNETTNYGSNVPEHMFELATKEVSVGSQSNIAVDVPAGYYNIYLVKEDQIVNSSTYRSIRRYEISRTTFNIYTDSLREWD